MKTTILVLLAVLGLTSGGWMLFDGVRRMVIGDYVRVNGQIGPWRHLFSAMGINPMGMLVAVLFVACGIVRLGATIGLLSSARWGWHAMLLSSVAILWLLPFGTINAVLTILILLVPWTRV
jgi:hypothetical protein